MEGIDATTTWSTVKYYHQRLVSNPKWIWAGRLFRVTRVGIAGVALYQLGFSAGIADYALDPKGREWQLIKGFVRSNGGEGVYPKDTYQYKHCDKIAQRVLAAAIAHCGDKLDELVLIRNEVKDRLSLLDEDRVTGNDNNSNSDSGIGDVIPPASANGLKTFSQIEKDLQVNSAYANSSNKNKNRRFKDSQDSQDSQDSKDSEDSEWQLPIVGNIGDLFGGSSLSSSSSSSSQQNKSSGEVSSHHHNNVALSSINNTSNNSSNSGNSSNSNLQIHIPSRFNIPKLDTVVHLLNKKKVIALCAQEKKSKEEYVEELLSLNSQLQEEITFWRTAVKRMGRRSKWKLIVNDSPNVNLFVADMLPRKVFINWGFIQHVKPNDEELALVLGHEISHYILQHGVAGTEEKMTWQIVFLMLAALVGPELYVFADWAAQFFESTSTAANSREHEKEADKLGLVLTARACFDTTKGANVLHKMAVMSGEGGEGEGEGHNLAQGGRERGGEGGEGDKEGVIEKTGKDSNTATTTTTGWMDTHPSSTDRFKWLSEQALEVSPSAFSSCGRAMNMWGLLYAGKAK